MIEVASYPSFQHSAMHETKGMPGQVPRIQTLQPLPPAPDTHTSVIRKVYHPQTQYHAVPQTHNPFDPVGPVAKHVEDFTHTLVHSVDPTQDSYGNNLEENMDTDDFSDHDSHYSEDLIDDIEDEQETEPEPDMTKQLLSFAENVNVDIKKFFGRKKGEDDSCDIYEDKMVSTKSGRELYYADLLKIIRGEDKEPKSSTGSSPLLDISNSANDPNDVCDNRHAFTGKVNRKLGLGPLNDLFEYGLRNFMSAKKLKNKESKRLKIDSKKYDDITPMQIRKLPKSFWTEPGAHTCDPKASSGHSVLQANNPPDFSDLLESWRHDRTEFSEEIGSEVSGSSEDV